MKKTFRIIVFAGLFSLFAGGAIAAQTTPPREVKRNSPFSPNPKKRDESAKRNSENNKNKPEEKIVKIDNAKLTLENTKQNETAPNVNAENKEAVFESRSVAKKTLEIARRAGNDAKSPTEIYKVGAGDVVDIRILNSPSKESTLFTVQENGLIDYPLAGEEPVQAAGLTPEEIESILKEKIKLYENPEIAVTVRDYASHTVNVLGLVERPGAKALRREAVPLYVILAEAIPHPNAGKVTILRGADKQTLTLNLEDNEALIYPNDIIRVVSGAEKSAGNQARFYYIGGAINSAGQKDFHDELTLSQAILASGGLKKSSARKVIIRRRDAEGKLVPTEYDLKLIKEGKVADPEIEAGDTIEIGN